MNVSAFSSAIGGLQAAESQVSRAAQETYDATVPTDSITLSSAQPDLVDATTDRITGEAMYRANIKVLQTADQMSNVLLDLITRG